jgi:hypothetical protein
MLMAYVSLDPVNVELFLDLAEGGQHPVQALEPRNGLPEGTVKVLLDWDMLPAGWRQATVKELRTRPNPPTVAVHSYHVPDGDGEDLRRLGVAVYRTLAEAVGAIA